MSFERREFMRGGGNAYIPLYEWAAHAEPFGIGEQNCVEYVLDTQSEKITDIFGTLYFPYTSLDENGEEQTEYLDCSLTNDEVYADFLATYGELPFMKPYFFHNEAATRVSLTRLISAFQAIMDKNYYKYKKLAATLGFKYNPIHNYEMEENGKDTETPTGTETHTHTVNTNRTGFVEIEGPASDIVLGVPSSETGLKSIDFSMADTTEIGYEEKAVSDIEAGNKTNMSGDPATTAGSNPTTNNYTTTMDSAATGRLKDYQTTSGTTAQASNVKGSQERPAMGRVKVGSDSPSYTDTASYTNKKVDKDHTFSRIGNIGVMSTQDMINQEREVVRFSLEKEFFDDLRKGLLLQIWD